MERDAETGNDHTWFRQYSSNTGRWLSPDPLGGNRSNPQSLNRYAYVMNNPTTRTDPLGLQTELDTSWADQTPYTVPWSGACDPRIGPMNVGCTWNGHSTMSNPHISCVSPDEYGCGNSGYGYDIFDALAHENGMSIWVDMKGGIQWAFDPEKWLETWRFIDYERSRGAVEVPTWGYGEMKYWDPREQTASTQDLGKGLSTYQGLITTVFGAGFRVSGTADQYDWSKNITLTAVPGGVNIAVIPSQGATPVVWSLPWP